MIRRLNYTGRKRIERDRAEFEVVVGREGPPLMRAELHLNELDLPPDAAVVVEAYRQTTLMRFPWGTVGHPEPSVSQELTAFGTAQGVKFRVKVVESARGERFAVSRILALAEGVSPRRVVDEDVQNEAILAIEFGDIEEVWRLDWGEEGVDEPVLIINRGLVENKQALVQSNPFATLVLPEVLRCILGRILLGGDDVAEVEAGTWQWSWFAMARSLPGVGPLPVRSEDTRDDLADWIDTCVSGFCRRMKTSNRFAQWWEDEEDA